MAGSSTDEKLRDRGEDLHKTPPNPRSNTMTVRARQVLCPPALPTDAQVRS